MPLATPNLAASITAGLFSVGIKGQDVSKLAQGIASGLVPWVRSLQVVTQDVGSAGIGTGFMLWSVPSPLLISNLLSTYSANGHIGTMAPLEATGLGKGLATGFLQGLIQTNHPGVGVGTGVAKIVVTPAFPNLMQGLASVQIKGVAAASKANAISQALTMTLSVFTIAIPIVGSASPAGASGVGIGRII